jgi:hypothetical protein
MAANDMPDDLQNPHPEVPLASVGDDTISALTDLAKFSNSHYDKLRPPGPKLHRHRYTGTQALPHHQAKY